MSRMNTQMRYLMCSKARPVEEYAASDRDEQLQRAKTTLEGAKKRMEQYEIQAQVQSPQCCCIYLLCGCQMSWVLIMSINPEPVARYVIVLLLRCCGIKGEQSTILILPV